MDEEGNEIREENEEEDKIDQEDKPKIVRPDVEFELPDFVALADEILEAEIAAEVERIRILNKTPVEVLCPR